MLPTINGKSFLECVEEDLKELLGNTAYRENEHIDYKEAFTIDSYSKGDSKRDKAIAELKSDICAFANADGGYLIFGVREDGEGVAKELVGIQVDNKDKFELNLNNWLQPIMPRTPTYKTAFIPLANAKYVVVIAVTNDFFAPYIHLVDEKDYRIYKRNGNSKRTIPYSELKNMFMQSMTLEKEIENYRLERIELFYDKEAGFYNCERFMLLHIIPDTFLDSSYSIPMYAINRKSYSLYRIFMSFSCKHIAFPTADGIRYIGERDKREFHLNDNGIAEVYLPLDDFITKNENLPKGFLCWDDLQYYSEQTIREYAAQLRERLLRKRVFVCFSIVGCKGIETEGFYASDAISTIDQHKMMVRPVSIEDITDENSVSLGIKRAKLEFMLSLGIRRDKQMNDLMDELYGE